MRGAVRTPLRLDGSNWKPLAKQDPLLEQLHLLCRDEIALIEERTALVNQLIAALYEYYPTALAAFEDWTLPAACAFVEAFATPQALVNAGKRRWEKFCTLISWFDPIPIKSVWSSSLKVPSLVLRRLSHWLRVVWP